MVQNLEICILYLQFTGYAEYIRFCHKEHLKQQSSDHSSDIVQVGFGSLQVVSQEMQARKYSLIADSTFTTYRLVTCNSHNSHTHIAHT